MSWGYVAVAGASLAGGLLSRQKSPKQAQLQQVDPQAEQREAIAGNLANIDDIEQLVSRTNRYTQSEANSLMEMAVPGFASTSQKFMELANENLDNPYALPDDVEQNLTRIAAERGITTGVRGQAGDFSLMRDLGINSLDYGNSRINQAQSIYQTVASLAPRVNPASPMAFYVTPQQQIDATVQNNTGQYNAQQSANNASAAASNANASMWGGVVANLGAMAGGAMLNNSGGSTAGGGRTVGNNSSGYVPASGTYYAPGSRPKYTGSL